MTQSRPIQNLNAAIRQYPETGRLVDEFRAGRGKGLPNWPDWCFLPMAAWYAIVSAGNKVDALPPHLSGDVARLAALGTWRYSQGIYQIDQDLMSALMDSPISGDLPSDVLYRLPEWCIYIETPGQKWLGDELYGFWAHMEWDANTGRTELRFLLDCEKNLIGLPLHVGAWTITEAVDRAISEAVKQAQIAGITLTAAPDDVQSMAAQINPLISILLYLCSEEPEIDDTREPGISPARPNPRKTKNGWRLFPADKPKIWAVGATIGAQLRHAAAGDQTDRTVKTHLRRGHWHGFWTGPRQGERKFIYRWISPLVVKAAH